MKAVFITSNDKVTFIVYEFKSLQTFYSWNANIFLDGFTS